MQTKTTKRIWMAALALVLAAGLSACADEPMAVEADDTYEVQADETTGCELINGSWVCH